MASTKSNLESLAEDLQRLRDELEVQLHLGAAEARDEWEQLEHKLGHFRAQVDKVAEAAEDAAEGVGQAASLAGEEIKKGYERIRSLLSK